MNSGGSFYSFSAIVKRMIKYTGYGNAAGLLAKRGLMLGGKDPTIEYSSSSDESDTEEYREVRHMLVPECISLQGMLILDRMQILF